MQGAMKRNMRGGTSDHLACHEQYKHLIVNIPYYDHAFVKGQLVTGLL